MNMPQMKTAVRGGLLLISAGAGAAAVNAYYRAKYPADPSPAVSRLLHNEVRRAQLHAIFGYFFCYLPEGTLGRNSALPSPDPLLMCRQKMLRLWMALTGSFQTASAATPSWRDRR